MNLDEELRAFEDRKPDLLKNHAGKFALIKGSEFLGAFDTPQNAYEEVVLRFGNTGFLVKRVSETEEIYRNQALFLGLVNAHI